MISECIVDGECGFGAIAFSGDVLGNPFDMAPLDFLVCVPAQSEKPLHAESLSLLICGDVRYAN